MEKCNNYDNKINELNKTIDTHIITIKNLKNDINNNTK
jgi:hypothetical protein